jgi:hypothetical protein
MAVEFSYFALFLLRIKYQSLAPSWHKPSYLKKTLRLVCIENTVKNVKITTISLVTVILTVRTAFPRISLNGIRNLGACAAIRRSVEN